MSIYYEPQKLLSYNALLNFVIGSRGVGKTYSIKKFCTNDFIRKGHQFVYLRRYKSELENAQLKKFFDPFIANEEFPDVALGVDNSTFLVNSEIAGFAIPLSTAKILKSTEFNRVKNIIFDEFIIDRGTYRYLNNEVFEFLDIIETIGRMRDVRVFLLGNSITTTNPYFTFFKMQVQEGVEFKTFKNGLICLEVIKNPAYEEAKQKSRFGQLVAGTSYGKYAIKNEWLRDSKEFLSHKSGNCRNFSIFILNGEKFGVWRDQEGKYFLSEDFDPNNPCTFAFNSSDHSEKTLLINARTSAWFKPVIRAYQNGFLFFESQRIKNVTSPILEKCLTH